MTRPIATKQRKDSRPKTSVKMNDGTTMPLSAAVPQILLNMSEQGLVELTPTGVKLTELGRANLSEMELSDER